MNKRQRKKLKRRSKVIKMVKFNYPELPYVIVFLEERDNVVVMAVKDKKHNKTIKKYMLTGLTLDIFHPMNPRQANIDMSFMSIDNPYA